MKKIIKRDGRLVDFDQNKIIDAVLAAKWSWWYCHG